MSVVFYSHLLVCTDTADVYHRWAMSVVFYSHLLVCVAADVYHRKDHECCIL